MINSDSLILTERAETQLGGIEKCLSKGLINAVCFYGRAGTGKTSYAMHLGDEYSSDVRHLDCARKGTNNKLMDELQFIASSGVLPMNDETKPFNRCYILDEFHNLPMKDQCRFKMMIEDYADLVLFLICLNVSKTKSYEKSVESAIRSRCEGVSFDIRRDELESHASKVAKQFPMLSREVITALLPDMRTITRKALLAS